MSNGGWQCDWPECEADAGMLYYHKSLCDKHANLLLSDKKKVADDARAVLKLPAIKFVEGAYAPVVIPPPKPKGESNAPVVPVLPASFDIPEFDVADEAVETASPTTPTKPTKPKKVAKKATEVVQKDVSQVSSILDRLRSGAFDFSE